MNTRRKLAKPKSETPSTRWHLMNEAFQGIFDAQAREHVEDWYNLGATGVQRDLFRDVCRGIYEADADAADPEGPSPYTAQAARAEADLLVKYYTRTLTELGRRKARAWILHSSSRRQRDNFRDVFAGCQTVLEKKSVMHRDYTPPEPQHYAALDTTHCHRDVDWTSLKARARMQRLQAQRDGFGEKEGVEGTPADGPEASSATRTRQQRQADREKFESLTGKHPSAVVDDRARSTKPRFTKPKSQFDGVNHLTSLGLPADMPAEQAVAHLKAKNSAFAQERRYYVDKDGSTVYVAAAGGDAGGTSLRPEARSVREGGMLAAVASEPISQWKVKTLTH